MFFQKFYDYQRERESRTNKKVAFFSILTGAVGLAAGFLSNKENRDKAKEVAKQFPENQGCPSGTQGGLLGLGRCIPVGDKDYNRGSLTGKGR